MNVSNSNNQFIGITKGSSDKPLYHDPSQTDDCHTQPNTRYLSCYVETDPGQERFVNLIVGRSGSGKSHYTRELIKYYQELFPIYCISSIPKEGCKGLGTYVHLEDLVAEDINQDETLYLEAGIRLKEMKYEMTLDDYVAAKIILETELKPKTKGPLYQFTDIYKKIISKPSLFVLDDVEALADQPRLKFLVDNILLTGRHNGINLIYIAHEVCNGQKTKLLLQELTLLTLFGKLTNAAKTCLRMHMFVPNKIIDTISKHQKNSRWFSVYRNQSIIMSSCLITSF